MQARASAVDELTAAGALTDLTGSSDDIDRQLQQISQSGQVDDELAKMKAELGSGDEPAKQLEGESPAAS
jgi:phage shock protein A